MEYWYLLVQKEKEKKKENNKMNKKEKKRQRIENEKETERKWLVTVLVSSWACCGSHNIMGGARYLDFSGGVGYQAQYLKIL